VLNEEVVNVVVGSPTGFHHEHAKSTLESGAHVICEKPVTIDHKDAWDVIEVAEKMRKHIINSFGRTYMDIVTKAKKLILTQGIGESHMHKGWQSGSPMPEHKRDSL